MWIYLLKFKYPENLRKRNKTENENLNEFFAQSALLEFKSFLSHKTKSSNEPKVRVNLVLLKFIQLLLKFKWNVLDEKLLRRGNEFSGNKSQIDFIFFIIRSQLCSLEDIE